MALFKLQERKEDNIEAIMRKSKEQKELKPTIKLKGTGLLEQLSAIKQKVQESLGEHVKDYQLITTDKEWIDYCNKAVEDGYVAIDTETDSLDSILAHLVGVCIYSKSQKPAYVPVGHISVVTEQKVEPQVSIEAITKGMEILKEAKCIFHNAYFDLVIIYQNTGVMLEAYWDILVGANLLNENEQHGLKYLYDKYCETSGVHTFGELFAGIPCCYVPYNIFMAYGAKDAYMTYKVWEFQLPYLTRGTEECKEYNLERVADLLFSDLMPMIPILVDMKLTGMLFDFKRAEELKVKYTKLLDDATQEFNESLEPFKDDILEYNKIHPTKKLEYPLNYNSPAQIKAFFYDINKIGVVYKKEPNGTGKNVIGAILAKDRFKNTPFRVVVEKLSVVKMYDKALNSFIIKLTEVASQHNGKIHSNMNLCGTVTGRLSSSEPNQQQVPSKSKDIRQIFCAGEGNVIIGCDFSKQEPCVLASTCKDEKLISVFTSGLDVYAKIASMMYNLPYEQCLEHNPDGTTNEEGKERRSHAKKVVLSIMYSKSEKSLAEDIHSTPEKARAIMDATLTAYPDMKIWMDNIVAQTKKLGYVENLFGRRRRLPDLHLPPIEVYTRFAVDESTKAYYTNIYTNKIKNARTKEEKEFIVSQAKQKGIVIRLNSGRIAKAEREIVNFCIQGASAIITLRAMRNIYNNPILRKYGCKLIMSVHDENLVVVPKEHAYECSKIIEQCSIDAGKGLPVPLSCDLAIAECWYGKELTFDENHNLIPKEK